MNWQVRAGKTVLKKPMVRWVAGVCGVMQHTCGDKIEKQQKRPEDKASSNDQERETERQGPDKPRQLWPLLSATLFGPVQPKKLQPSYRCRGLRLKGKGKICMV